MANSITKIYKNGVEYDIYASAGGGEVDPATSTTAGTIKLGSDTEQSVAANSPSSTASRTYPIQVNSSGQGVVNVPRTDTNTTYTATDFDIKDLTDSTSLRSTWSNKQDALSSQTAYTSKGSATKVPQISTNSLGQVTSISEVTITQPTVSVVSGDSGTTYTIKVSNSDPASGTPATTITFVS